MLTYQILSRENIDEAIALVRSVFPNEFNSDDSPETAYKASLDRGIYKDFITRHNLEILNYFVAKDQLTERIVGVTGWYTRNIDKDDVV